MAVAVVLVTLEVALPRGLAAQSLEDGRARAGEVSWGDYLSPQRRRGRHLRRDGLVRLLEARRADPLGPASDVVLEQALGRLTRARAALPDDPDVVLFIGLALAAWEADRDGDGEPERRIEEAIGAFEDLRRMAPEHHPDRVAFELGILFTRQGDHDRAVTEYRRALAEAHEPIAPPHFPLTARERELAAFFTPVDRTTVLVNLGEVAMLAGDLETSIASYREATERARDAPIDRTLSLWGLAVALDRAGEHREALAAAQRAIQGDPFPLDDRRLRIDHTAHGPMAILHSVLVFFEPSFEVHVYDAIGWEALARQAGSEADRLELLERARRAIRTYLTAGGNGSRYAEHASRTSARLEEELAAAGRPAAAAGR